MVADIVILTVEQTYIICCRLDLCRLKGDILLIALTTVNDDTIIAVFLGSFSELNTSNLLGDNNLPGHTKRTHTREP